MKWVIDITRLMHTLAQDLCLVFHTFEGFKYRNKVPCVVSQAAFCACFDEIL